MNIGFITTDEITNEYPTLAVPQIRNGAKLEAYFILETDGDGNPTALTPIYVAEATAEEQEIIAAIEAGDVDEEPEQTDLDDIIEQRIEEGYYED